MVLLGLFGPGLFPPLASPSPLGPPWAFPGPWALPGPSLGPPWAFLGPWALGPGAAKTDTAAKKTDTAAKKKIQQQKNNDAANIKQTDGITGPTGPWALHPPGPLGPPWALPGPTLGPPWAFPVAHRRGGVRHGATVLFLTNNNNNN